MQFIPSRKWTQSGIADHPPRDLQEALYAPEFVLPEFVFDWRDTITLLFDGRAKSRTPCEFSGFFH